MAQVSQVPVLHTDWRNQMKKGESSMLKRIILVAALSFALLPLAASAQYVFQSDGGFFDLQVDKNGKIKKQRILWVWAPHYQAGTVTYEVFAFCSREGADGNRVGTNKVTFQGIKFLGGGVELSIPKLAGKLKSGAHPNFLNREVSQLGILAAGSTVIGEATAVVKGKLNAGDRMFCQIDVTESPAQAALGVNGLPRRTPPSHR